MDPTLTDSSDRSPVGDEPQALTEKQAWSEAHDFFKQVLQSATHAAFCEDHLLEELVLPEGVNWHQISSVEDTL